jgi:hypothetical protein
VSDRSVSSTPERLAFGHDLRFEPPARSRGTSISTGPTSVGTAFERRPLQESPEWCRLGRGVKPALRI